MKTQFDIYEEVGIEILTEKFKDKTMNIFTRHNFFTFGFWACVIVVGVFQALNGAGVGDFTALIGAAGMLEHIFAGNIGR